jgi:hypothetical protein
VTVWRIVGYDWLGYPQFTPGGFCTVDFDANGKMRDIIRGE